MSLDRPKTQPYEHENDVSIINQQAYITYCNKEMRLESYVRRDDKMDLKGPHTYYMFTSTGILPLETMSADAHSMTSRVFMGSMHYGFR